MSDKNEENTILLYHDENGKTNVSVRFADEDVWVTQVQLAELYDTTRQNIGQHIENIYKDEELPREATIKKFFIVQQEGKREVRRELDHYNLDVIIAIGYRVQSTVATRFRRWATARLHEYIQTFVIKCETLLNVFMEPCCRPPPESGCNRGLDAIADGDDDVEIVMV